MPGNHDAAKTTQVAPLFILKRGFRLALGRIDRFNGYGIND